MGVKTPAGSSISTFWQGILSGKSFAAPIQSFDVSNLPIGFACEIHDFEPRDYFGQKELSMLDRSSQLGLAAAIDALQDADPRPLSAARCAVVVGSAMGG